MNGPDHYRAAELLLADARTDTYNGTGVYDPDLGHVIAAAQAHATLALAAATAIDWTKTPSGEWQAVAS